MLTPTRRQLLGGVLALCLPPPVRAAGPPSRQALLSGRAEPPAAPLLLRAGPVTAEFEPGIAFLRYVRWGDREILRGLYAAVRDQVWGTVAPRVSNIVHEARPDSFRLTFDVENKEGDIDFAWQGVITGAADGTVRFEFNGRARSSFLKNRLGFAVLHPLRECAGKPCVVEKTSGVKENGAFPDTISPHQPLLDLRAVSHEVVPGLMAEVRMEGDTFEMEDHRNWTDGNFKTYCTPLARPFPVAVSRGQEIRQAVTIRLKGAVPPPRRDAAPEIAIHLAAGREPVKLPAIGLGFAAGQPALTPQETARLRQLRPAHLRVDVRLWDPAWKASWESARRQAAALGAQLEAAVFLSPGDEAELKALAAAAPDRSVARWLVFHKDDKVPRAPLLALARTHLRGAPIAGGTNEYFTELNRERPPVEAIDLSCYSINPQVHAFDNRSLVENLAAQADTVRTARTFLGGKPVAVTPVTLRPRFNPQAKGAPEPVVEGRLPSRIDPRQMSLFGAAWTLGSLKYLAESGVASITYYETHGWAGVMETARGAPMPALFPSIPGAVFPLYHVLAAAGEMVPAAMVHPLESGDPLRACAMAAAWAGRRRVLVANLTADPQIVSLDAAWLGARARVRMLDEHSAESAMREPEKFRTAPAALTEASGGRHRLALLPYAVAMLDSAA